MTEPRRLVIEAREELGRLLPALDALLGALDDARWRARPAAGEWSPLEVVCHLRDEEAEDFPARIRVIVAGGAEFLPIDPEGWVEARRYGASDPRQALDALRAGRAANLAFLDTVDPERLGRSIRHPRVGELSGLDLLVAWVAHDRLHLAQLAATLARLWADRCAPLRAEYAGPLPYAPPAG